MYIWDLRSAISAPIYMGPVRGTYGFSQNYP